MLRHPPRVVLAWIAAAAVALLTAHTVAADLAALHRRARSAGPVVDAVVARRDLPLGTTVTPDALSTVGRFRAHLPPGALRAVGQAAGRVVATPVLRGSVVTDRHLAPRTRNGLDGVVPPGMRAARVVVEQGVHPRPGALVDVLVSFDPARVGAGRDPTMAVVRGATVLDVDDRAGPGSSGGDRIGVTLLVDPDAARRLAFAAANGVVTLTLAPPEDARGVRPGADRSG